MEHKPIAIDFIRHHFPAKTTASLNTDTLQLLKQSYIDNDLQEIALNMKMEGSEAVFIAKVTGLTMAEVERLTKAE